MTMTTTNLRVFSRSEMAEAGLGALLTNDVLDDLFFVVDIATNGLVWSGDDEADAYDIADARDAMADESDASADPTGETGPIVDALDTLERYQRAVYEAAVGLLPLGYAVEGWHAGGGTHGLRFSMPTGCTLLATLDSDGEAWTLCDLSGPDGGHLATVEVQQRPFDCRYQITTTRDEVEDGGPVSVQTTTSYAPAPAAPGAMAAALCDLVVTISGGSGGGNAVPMPGDQFDGGIVVASCCDDVTVTVLSLLPRRHGSYYRVSEARRQGSESPWVVNYRCGHEDIVAATTEYRELSGCV